MVATFENVRIKRVVIVFVKAWFTEKNLKNSPNNQCITISSAFLKMILLTVSLIVPLSFYIRKQFEQV